MINISDYVNSLLLILMPHQHAYINRCIEINPR